MLDGAARIKDLISEVQKAGQTAVAITDHGVLHGAYDLWKQCTATQNSEFPVKPIIGVEAYMTPGTSRKDDTRVYYAGPYGDSAEEKKRRRKDVSFLGTYTHMTMWASTNEGLKNLNLMQTLASEDKTIGKYARVDRDLLQQYSKDVIATSGCPSGAVATRIAVGQYKEALREAGELQDIFGKENFYIELMDHSMKEDVERRLKQGLLDIAKALNAPLLATNDLHYAKAEDAIAQDALLCINSSGLIDMPGDEDITDEQRAQGVKTRFKFGGSGYYVKSTDEMYDLFKEFPEALTNSKEIADRCNTNFEPEMGRFMPHVPVPETKIGEREVIRIKTALKDYDDEQLTKEKPMPKYQDGVKDDYIQECAFFIEEVYKGFNERFPNGTPEVPEGERTYKEQLDYEIDTILGMGFPSYFLVTADFVQWAKNNDIFVGPGRGSAAGSIVAYSLQITDLDPIEHKLVFERFLNPERISLPDIDIDFENGGREQVIEYCAQKYGRDNVAQIITFGMIMGKQAVRDAARIMGYDYNAGDLLSKAFPGELSLAKWKINDIINPKKPQGEEQSDDDYKEYSSNYALGEPLRDLYNQFTYEFNKDGADEKTIAVSTDSSKGEGMQSYRNIIELAIRIENLVRGWGVHASGVLVSSDPIRNVCPTLHRPDDGATITQFEAHGCEDLGFVKMDFLGLKNLNTNKATLKNIIKAGKEPVDLLKIPLDDKKTFELIAKAETTGVFQLDGDGMRTLMKRMRPTKFDDISATIALFRPGPMGVNAHNDFADRKNGRKKIETIGEGKLAPAEVQKLKADLDDILGDTYGLVVFQEQIQFAARKLAGFSLGQADLLRRAMGKKNIKDLMEAKSSFVPGMLKNGYSEAAADAVWSVFQPFASYAFNRAHTACYGFIAYQNAYLKANYPVEYMAALLTTNENNHAKLGVYLAECARMGIKVEVPDVNRSSVDFAPDEGKILFGLGAVRNIGEGIALDIIQARETKGAFEDFNDFLYKVPEGVCNKRKIESLIKAGALDKFGNTRRSLIAIHSEAVDAALPVKKKEAAGQFDLFSALGMSDAEETNEKLEMHIPELEEFDKKSKLDFEKEMLGLYVSDHPLAQFAKSLASNADFSLSSLDDKEAMSSYASEPGSRSRRTAYVAGMITSVSRRVSKKSGNPWAQIIVEDLSGTGEIAFFGRSFEGNQDKFINDAIVKVKVNVDVGDDGTARLSGSEIENLNLTAGDEVKEVVLKLTQSQCVPSNIEKLQGILKRHHGDSKVVLEVKVSGKKKEYLELPPELNVNPGSALYGDLAAEFGNVF
ncbi:DNA-directed DNA polymerase [Actinomycetota bacterium]|nr:DNA-directed DNA polymerase [Actinomycetota bacterium]